MSISLILPRFSPDQANVSRILQPDHVAGKSPLARRVKMRLPPLWFGRDRFRPLIVQSNHGLKIGPYAPVSPLSFSKNAFHASVPRLPYAYLSSHFVRGSCFRREPLLAYLFLAVSSCGGWSSPATPLPAPAKVIRELQWQSRESRMQSLLSRLTSGSSSALMKGLVEANIANSSGTLGHMILVLGEQPFTLEGPFLLSPV